jgi:hypothetical protein
VPRVCATTAQTVTTKRDAASSKSGFTAPRIVRAQCLDDSPIEIGQRIGHTQTDQLGAALSKVSTRIGCFVHVVHRDARHGDGDRAP